MKKYAKYKDSGLSWVGKIPKNWQKRNLQDVAREDRYSFTGGPFGSDLKSEEYTESGVRIIQLQNIGVGEFLDKYKIYTSEEKANQLSSCNIFPNDIIIAKMADPVARACLMPFGVERYLMASDGIRLDVDENEFDKKYLVYSINSSYFRHQAELRSTGTTRLRIGLSALRKLKIFLPPFEEQKSISKYLDRKTTIIDTLLEKTKQKITTLQEQRTAIINQAVTKGLTHLPPAKGGTKGVPLKKSGVERIGNIPENWEVKKTSYLCSEMKSGPFGSSLKKSSYTKTGYKIYGQEQVIKDDFSYGDYFIGEEKFNELRRCEIFAGDILISCVGTFGKIAMVPNEFQKGIINPRLLKLTPNNLILSRYFLLVLRSSLTFSQLTALSRGGTMGVINLDILRQLKFPIPSLKEQEEIYNYVNQKTKEVDTLIQKEQQRINLLKEYRQSLISEVVTGKRCVHNEIPVT